MLSERDDSYQWRLCPAQRLIPIRPGYTDPTTDPESIEVRADASRIVEQGLSQFSGDVEIVRGDQSLSAENVTYDQVADVFNAEGRAHIWNPGLIWSGESATYDLDSRVTDLSAGKYWLLDGRGRGHAEHLRNDRVAQRTVLDHVDYSTCPQSAESWRLSASKIKLNHESDRGAAINAVLRVRDVPVFYFPYVSFPISDKRKSGLLAPTIGSTNDSGVDVRLPYYWNIAPNMDATITPRALTDRGAMLETEYRYLTETMEGRINFEYLPNDRLEDHHDRSLFGLEHSQDFYQGHGRLTALVNNVSDDQYFEDFGSNISSTSQRFMDRRLEYSYRGTGSMTYFNGIVQAYQSIDPTLPPGATPYRRLPQIDHIGVFSLGHGFTSIMTSQTTYFHRDVGLTGGRLDFQPALLYTYWKPYLLIQPKLTVQRTDYLLDDPQSQFDNHIERTVPKISIDAKLFAERDLTMFGGNYLQTFEPRVYYLLVPKVSQDDIPVFDSGQFILDFNNMFLDNRFSGRDRVGEANQVATAITSRLLDVSSGLEMMRMSVGQVYYFRDREVQLPRRPELDDSVSTLLADGAFHFGRDLLLRGTLQWDPNQPRIEKTAVNLRYQPNYETVINLGYRLRRAVTDVEQTDVSFRVPVLDNLAVVGRWIFSLADKRSLETVGGLEFESCCWGARVVGRRFLLNANGEYDTGVFFQVHFRGLGGVGQKSGSMLRRGIGGYSDPFE
ncbi:MAG: LPS assembly protein LptD [Gammaproteobacteria bacterium]|nr:LPS assembly protein LptD [Gammaproteobacteria bacterium]